MKHQTWLAVAMAAGIALTGCSSMHSGSDQGSNTGTMRRAESGSSRSSTNPDARNPNCAPGDTRQNCPPDSSGSRTNSIDRSSESSTDVQTPPSGAPVPR